MLQELFKGKGSSSICSNFRDVMLACVDGKNVAKYVRSKLLPRAHNISLNTQFGGGFNGGETAFAHLYVRLVNQACKAAGMTCANLFLDVISAFASLLRCIVFDTEAGDEAWLHKLKSHGFTQDDIDSTIRSVKACSNWRVDNQGLIVTPEEGEQYDISLGLAKTWYSNTWISQEGIPNVMLTDQGSLAGTPFADLAYTFAMSRVMSVFRNSLAICKIESHVDVNGTRHKVEDVSFVDDVTVLIIDDANGIIEKCVL